MTVTVPEAFEQLLEGGIDPSDEVRIRLAAHFYSTGQISVGRAAELSGMTRPDFERWLKEHGINMPWSPEDLKAELSWAKKA